ncbi:MAG: flavodoxin domain-containing protein [Candidatus Bathyarchaeota archaeon]|nr:flavodoxin domain-containing protein [Candidatus Bathyarchaeota archaeon]
MKTLIVYGTRYGATADTSQEIAKVLQSEGFEVKVVNAKEEKVKDISPYDLILVGSGMQMFKWTGEAEDFLKKFRNQLLTKKLVIFVSSAVKSAYEREGKKEELAKIWKSYLEDKAAKYALQPLAMAMFGGIIDYNKMNPITRRAFGSQRKQYEADGFKENPPDVYDMRDMEEIRKWSKELADKAGK